MESSQTETHKEMTEQAETLLVSSEGDETLKDVSFFLHGTSSLIDAERIQENGLSVREGRATVSTDLEHALKWAMGANRHYSESQTERDDDEIGRIIVVGKPDDYKIDYGLYTDATIKDKEVTGSPIKYASGRKQLALYRPDSKKEDLRSITKDERERLTLAPECIEAVIKPSEEMQDLISGLSIKVKKLEEFNISDYSKKLADAIKKDSGNKVTGDVNELSRQLITTTVESIAISKMRNLYLDILTAKGFKIFENTETQSRPRDLSIVSDEVSALYNKSHQGNFDIGIKWLNKMIIAKTEALLEETK